MRFRLLEGVAAIAGEGETPHAPEDMPRVLIWRGLAFLRIEVDDTAYVDGRAVYRCVHAELLNYDQAKPPGVEPRTWTSPTALAHHIASVTRETPGADPWPLPRRGPEPAAQPPAQLVTKARRP